MTAETNSGAPFAPDTNDPFFPDDQPATSAEGAPGDAEHGHAEHGDAEGGASQADAPLPDSDGGDESAAGSASRKKRRRGSRGGRRRRGRAGQTETADAAVVTDAIPGDEDSDSFEPDEAPDAEAPAGAEEPADAAAVAEKEPRSRRGRRGRRGRGRGREGAAEPQAALAGPTAAAPARATAARTVVPRELDALGDDELDQERAADAEADAGGDVQAVEAEEAGEAGEALSGGRKRRRRGSRGGRRRKGRNGEAREGEPRAGDARPQRGARTAHEPVEVEAIPGEEDDLPLPPKRAAAPAKEPEKEGRGRRRKKRGREAEEAEQDTDAVRVVPESERKAVILVNATDPEEQRVAVVEDGKITDFLMTVKDQDTLVNDIYRGRVVNLEPAIGAAFIDFGQGRNGFLHTSDVLSAYGEKDFTLDKLLSTQIDPEEWDENSSQPSVSAELLEAEDAKEGAEKPKKGGRAKGKGGRSERRLRARPRRPITELLKKGQQVVVQVTKDAIGDKGPTLTTYISIPGRYLVLMPSMARTGVSRKIEDEKERRRLKRILQSLNVPHGMGVIVRTAGVGHSKVEIQRDLDYLTSLWEAFGKKLNHGHGPAPLYRESDVAIRTMRDLYSPATRAVIVDDPEVQRHIVEFTEKLMPEDVERIHLHSDQKPLFQAHGLEQDFERIFQRRVELPSGGSIVFDQAEALVAIDVNSGRTRSDGFDFEDIALKTNLEAVPEIARQIRLRDLGGIIVVDFIDMMKMSNIRAVERAFKDELSTDRARSKLGRISQFGLLEMTRQRLGPGMNKKVFTTCPRCRGTGRIRTVNSRAAAILRRLSSAMTHKGFQTVEVRAHPEVVAYLKSDCFDHVRALEYRFQREVRLLEAADQPEDSVLRYLRADGREVRPGGRRKR